MDEEKNITDMSIEEVKAEIDRLKSEIAEHTEELDGIRAQSGSADLSEGEDVYKTPNPDENADNPELEQRAKELESLILQKQMKIAALEKRLNDLIANEGMQNYNEEE